DGGNRAVDIYGQPLARGPFREHDFHGPDHLNVPAFDFQLQGHLKQSRGARIARMEAVTEAGDWLRRSVPSLADLARSIAVRVAFADQLETCVQKLHAHLDVAAVMPAESEHTRRHARAQRRAGCRGVPRGQRRWRRDSVIDERYEYGFHQAPDGRRGDLAH